MYMNKSEICTSYRDAKDQSKQIKILSELNGCDTETIKKILEEGGYDTSKPIYHDKVDYMTISENDMHLLRCLPLTVRNKCKGKDSKFIRTEFIKFVKSMYKTNTIEEISRYTGVRNEYIKKIVKG